MNDEAQILCIGLESYIEVNAKRIGVRDRYRSTTKIARVLRRIVKRIDSPGSVVVIKTMEVNTFFVGGNGLRAQYSGK